MSSSNTRGRKGGLKKVWKQLARRWRVEDSPSKNSWLIASPEAGDATVRILNLVGWALLASAALRHALLFADSDFANPDWELQAFSTIASGIWVAFVGIALIFYRRPGVYIHRRQLHLLASLRWFCLLMGIVFILAIPLGVRDTIALDRRSTQLAQEQRAIRQQRFSAARDRLSGDNINAVQLDRLSEALLPAAEGTVPKDKIRGLALERIQQEEDAFNAELASQRGATRRRLLQTSLQANFGLGIAAVASIALWVTTRWVQWNLSSRQIPTPPVPTPKEGGDRA